MLLINFVVSLLFGGFLGLKIGQHYNWPVAISMIVGALIGGLSYRPIEVFHALKQAISEILEFRGKAFLQKIQNGTEWIGNKLHDGFLYISGMAIWGYCCFLYLAQPFGYLFGGEPKENGGASFIGTMSGLIISICVLLWFLSLDATTDAVNDHPHVRHLRKWASSFIGNPKNERENARCFFRLALIMGFLGTPVGLMMMITRITPSVLSVVPLIFFRFSELVATHARLTVMSSCGIGVWIGSCYTSSIIAALTSLGVGIVLVGIAKLVTQHIPDRFVLE